MKEYGQEIDEAVSIGLGAGDNGQGALVAAIAKYYPGTHINQVFPAVGATRANLGEKDSWINSLVSLHRHVRLCQYLNWSELVQRIMSIAIVPVKTAIALVRDMGGNALKYFPMKGLSCEDEFRAVAQACG